MTEKRIIFEMPDGTIRIALPIAGSQAQRASTSEQDWFDREAAKLMGTNPNLAGAIRLRDHHITELPHALRWKRAWRNDGAGSVEVNMPAARAQRMGEIRTERDKRLTATDADKNRLDDIGTAAQKTALATKRQTLRDIPQNVDLETISTPGELETFEPEWPE